MGDDFWESSHRNAIVACLSFLGLISFILRLPHAFLALRRDLAAGIKHTCDHIGALWHCQKGVKGLLVSRGIWPTLFIRTVASAESESASQPGKRKGLFSLGDINAIWWLKITGAQSMLREALGRLSGTPKQEYFGVMNDTVGRMRFSVIQQPLLRA